MFAASKTASVSGGYQISRSLRFNSADSAYLNRTPAGAGNRRTFTFSTWIKRSFVGTGADNSFFDSYVDNSNRFDITFGGTANAQLYISNVTAGSTTMQIGTSAVFRDASAWYHIVFSVDTTQATSTNRVAIYVNGVAQTVSGTYPSLNEQLTFNYAIQHTIGAAGYSGLTNYLGAYMTEVNFIDGQALTPSSFGETNAQTGVWQPKAYSGSYGTNGFYLNFSDNSNTTAATLGKDYSGNGNNWTPNNFSVTAGAGNDSLVDSPTSYGTDTGVGGTVRGNYCTLNPLNTVATNITLANGNLDYSQNTLGGVTVATFGVSSGQWYWETQVGSSNYCVIGMYQSGPLTMSYLGQSGVSLSVTNGGTTNQLGVSAPTGSMSAFTSSDVIGYALNMDTGTLTVYRNNVSALVYTGLTGTWFPAQGANSTANGTFNFGQRPFAYTAPSGYKALCTQNLPTPTIGATTATQAGKFFNPVLYTGNAGTLAVTGVGFQPDFVWAKGRSVAYSHGLFDAVRGATLKLTSNSTNAEATESGLTAFNSDGFTLGSDVGLNSSSATYVAWNWKANGSGSTNTSGSITSTVSANTTSGFSIVTYTGTGSAATVGHGLGVAPRMFIVKQRTASSATSWYVYHASLSDAPASAIYLNLTNAQDGPNAVFWNNTAPTSSVFSIGTSAGVSASAGTYVAYCFAEVAGYSKFGSYTGNGSADGAFVYTGFRPAYVMIKRTTSAYDWWILDVARGTINAVKGRLYANASDAESTTYPYLDFLSNGFKLRDADGGLNASGEPYIYMCFASNPFKYSLAR